MLALSHPRSLLIAGITFLAIGAGIRAEITENDVTKWRTEYSKEIADLVERDLSKGKTQIQPEHRAKIELAAKYYTAQVKFVRPDAEGAMNRWFRDISSLIDQGKEGEFHQQFLKVFAAQSAKTALNVLGSPLPDRKLQTEVNVARLLAKLAEYGQEDTLYVLLTIFDSTTEVSRQREWYGEELPEFKKAKNEGAIYYAAKGLAGFFAWRNRDSKVAPMENKELETQALSALVRVLHNPEGISDDAPDDRLDGFRVMRREVIRALGQSRYPATKVDKEELQIALELGRIVRAAKVVPAPRMDERVEAAIGLALLDPALRKGYEPEYAAREIGIFVYLFADRYNKREPALKSPALMSLLGVRLAEALGRAKQSKDVSDYQKRIAELSITVLTNLKDVDKGNPVELRDFLEKNKPNADAFYKDVETSSLTDDLVPVKEHGEK